MIKTKAGDIVGNVPDYTLGERLLRMKEIEQLVGVSRQTIYRQISLGNFPRQVHPFGGKAARWRLSDVRRWLAERSSGEAA